MLAPKIRGHELHLQDLYTKSGFGDMLVFSVPGMWRQVEPRSLSDQPLQPNQRVRAK